MPRAAGFNHHPHPHRRGMHHGPMMFGPRFGFFRFFGIFFYGFIFLLVFSSIRLGVSYSGIFWILIALIGVILLRNITMKKRQNQTSDESQMREEPLRNNSFSTSYMHSYTTTNVEPEFSSPKNPSYENSKSNLSEETDCPRFCMNCGNKLDIPAETSSVRPLYCSHCGFQLK